MTNEQLLIKYSEIERKIQPIVEFLEENKTKYKDLYKGIITLQSPIVFQPEILFLGVNPGEGAYRVLNNQNSKKKNTPLRMIGKDETFLTELNWYELGNARGGWIKEKWQSYEWYKRDKVVNNSFPKQMIDLLYEIGKHKYPNEFKSVGYSNDTEPFWYNTLGKSIMYSNLYPIATTNITDLYKILNSIAKVNQLNLLWENQENPNNWDVRKFFIKLTDELIDLVKPKIIVCLGKSAFDDFLFKKHDNNKKVYKSKKNNISVIGFSRQGNWSGLLSEVADKIVKANYDK